MQKSDAWSKKGLWNIGNGSSPEEVPPATGGALRSKCSDTAYADAAASASAAVAASVAKRWSMGTNSDDEEFEMVLADSDEIEAASVPLAQYKVSLLAFLSSLMIII